MQYGTLLALLAFISLCLSLFLHGLQINGDTQNSEDLSV